MSLGAEELLSADFHERFRFSKGFRSEERSENQPPDGLWARNWTALWINPYVLQMQVSYAEQLLCIHRLPVNLFVR